MIRLNSPAEALIVEQALAMYREMKRLTEMAPDGQVLDRGEPTALTQGRELTRKGLEAVLNEQAQEVEKGTPARTCTCGGSRQHRGGFALSVLTVADEAKWIWEEAEMHFAGVEGVLDIYHALEHLGETAKTLCGEGTAKAAT